MAKHRLFESLSAILICMAIASMCFAACFVAKTSARYNFMLTILLMMIVSAIVRVVERFNFTDLFLDPKSDSYGLIIGAEISITWGTLLVAEFLLAMKYF